MAMPRVYAGRWFLVLLAAMTASVAAGGASRGAEEPPATAPPAVPPPAVPPSAATPPAAAEPKPGPAAVPAAERPPEPPAHEPPRPRRTPRPGDRAGGAATPRKAPLDRLLEPEIVKRLKLSDEQRAKLATLLAERDAKLRDAKPGEQARLAESFEQQANDLLTEPQRAAWAEVRSEPRLRFQFRFQRWADVLEWFAQEADLSLVLDAPPPGTFNYSDTRDYSPAEAIDLLNGVLLTKGYTLIRRERMLLVIHLKDGLPEALVPHVELADLDARGKFELVTVKFPIGRRAASAVVAEITPLLGAHGKVVPLGATQQVMVSDAAGIMRSVAAIIESLPEPAVSAVAGGPPVLATYPIKPADPKVVVQALAALLPAAKVVVDDKADRLIVHAAEAEQAVVKRVIEEMQAAHPPEKQPRLEVYSVAETTAEQTLAALKVGTPELRASIDPKGNKIAVWASAAEHETIKKTIEKLEAERGPGKTRQLEVYRLTRVDPAATLALLQNLLPEAKLSADAQNKTLVALAYPSDHQVIRTTLQTLQPEKAGADTPEMRFHPLSLSPPPELLSVLKRAVPDATIAMDANADRLVVVAVAADHERIQATIEKFERNALMEGRSKLVAYPVTLAQRTRFQAVLSSLKSQLPGIQVITDAEPGELSIWAKPQQHDVIAGILAELKRDVPADEKYQLAVYDLAAADPEASVGVLQKLFPETKFVVDAKGKRLMVWTRAAEHAAIKAAVEQVAPPGEKQQLVAYQIKSADLASVAGLLEKMFPALRIVADRPGRRLAVWARPEEHVQVKAAIEQLDSGPTGEGQEKVMVYPTAKGEGQLAIAVLKEMLPDVRMQTDYRGAAILAWARPKDHETIRKVLDEIQLDNHPDRKQWLETYPLEGTVPGKVLTTFQLLAPNARITTDAATNSLVVLAIAKDHETIKEAVGKLGLSGKLDSARQVEVYRLTKADPTAAVSLLERLVPGAKLTVDERSRSLIALASLAEQKTIRATLEQLQPEQAGPNDPELRIYSLSRVPTTTFTLALQKLVPGAQLTADPMGRRLMVVASAADHAVLKAGLDEMEKTAAQQQERLATYPLKTSDLEGVAAALGRMYPNGQFTADRRGRRLIVTARPEDHEGIKAAVAELDSGPPPADAQEKLMVYPVTKGDVKTLVQMLQEMFPDMEFGGDVRTATITAKGTKADQALLARAVEEMTQPDEQHKPQIVVYPLGQGDAIGVRQMLSQLAPNAMVTASPRTRQVVALATPQDQEMIKTAMQRISGAGEAGNKAATYTLDAASPTAALALLKEAVPTALVAPGAEPRQIVAWANAEDQKAIAEIVKQMSDPGAAAGASTVAAYTVPSGAAGAVMALRFLLPDAKCAVGGGPNQLVAYARPVDHAKIKDIVEKLGRPDSPVRVYRFRRADPRAAQLAFAGLAPNAQIALDLTSRALVVSAADEDHAKIAAAVKELDSDEAGLAAKVQIHRLTKADAANVLLVLQGLFKQRLDVQLALDARNDAVVAVASPPEQEIISRLIQQIEQGAAPDAAARVQLYPLTNIDSTTALTVLARVLETQGPKSQLSIEPLSNQLVAVARPDQHDTIQRTLAQLRSDERSLEIIALESLETGTATLAINRLFAGEGFNGPQVDGDPATQQLFIRASQAQMAKIRDLLAKLGETGLTARPRSGGTTRIVPFAGDSQATVEELQRLWPQLRNNPLKVVPASAVAPLLEQKKPGGAAPPDKPPPDKPPAEKPVAPPPGQSRAPSPPGATMCQPAAGGSPRFDDLAIWFPPGPWTLLGQVAAPAAAEPPKPAGPPPPPAALPPKPAAPPATVLIAPSEGSILMASDDIEALDQLESLVRAIGQRTGYSGRNFSVFPVRNTSATRAAATLQQLFRSNQPASPRSYLTAANSLVIVPDERLNLVLVQGNRSDRATIESMLRVLDSAETPAVLGAHQPRIVAIENTKAARVEQLLRTVFRAQMATQGGGAAGATPGWLATDLAVDDATNSLIVMAPPQLAESICQFAQQLDKAAGDDPSRNISIVRLKSANAARVQSVLDSVLKKRSGSTSVRSSSYPRSASSGSGSSGAASSQHRPP